jgi:hypothetical protein
MKADTVSILLFFFSSTALAQSVSRVVCVSNSGGRVVENYHSLYNAVVTPVSELGLRASGRPVIEREFLNAASLLTCRSWYIHEDRQIRGTHVEHTYVRRDRDWNEVSYELLPFTLELVCGVGSKVETFDSIDAFKNYTVRVETPRVGESDRLGGYISGQFSVSDAECVSFKL